MSPYIETLLPLGGTLLGVSLALAMVRIRSLSVAGYSRQNYRAIEEFDLKTGLLLTMVVLLLAASAPLAAKLLEPQAPVSDIIDLPTDTPKRPIVFPPPPPIDPNATNNLANVPAVAKAPTVGIPKPVEDHLARPEDDITPDEALNLYARNATPDSIIQRQVQTDKISDEWPEPGTFVPYDRQPQAIVLPKPVYPEICLRTGIEGMVVIQVLIDKKGEVVRALVQKTSGNPALDEAALEAARLSRFTPAMQGDIPVSVWVSIPFTFKVSRQ